MIAPAADGLIDKGIMQSGGIGFADQETAQATAAAIIEELVAIRRYRDVLSDYGRRESQHCEAGHLDGQTSSRWQQLAPDSHSYNFV